MSSRLFLSLLFSIVLCGHALVAQVTTASISGVVKDATGAVLPGVTVTVKNLDTGVARTVLTDDQGRYSAPNLSLGEYEVQAELHGFQTGVRSGIKLTVGREATLDFTLHVGELSEKVVVTGEASLVDTSSATLGGLVDDKKIRELPLNGRDITQLLFLETGVTFARRGSSGATGGFGKRVSISGARPEQVGWLLDGTDVQNTLKTGPATASASFLGVETVKEFKVVTNAMSAEFGTVGGGVMNAVTKSGTNEFHGSAFEFLRNDNLDARNFFDLDPNTPLERSDPPEFKRNQFGFTAGGPILRDRTFFFGSYEGLREKLTTTQIARVPTADARRGVLPGRPPLTVHPLVQTLLPLFPLPNGRDFGNGTAEFISPRAQPTREDYFTARIDHNFSDRHSFFGRYTFDDADDSEPDRFGLIADGDTNRHQYLTLQQQSIFSPRFLNTFRFGFNRSFDGTLFAPLRDVSPLVLIPRPFPAQFNIPLVGTLGLSTTVPRVSILNLFEWADDVHYTSGAHSVKFGMLAKRYRVLVNEESRAGGRWRFRRYEDFLTGVVNFFDAPLVGTDRVRNMRQTLLGFYAQDSWKARPTLTLNLGLRYEFVTVPTEIDDRLANLRFPLDPETTVGPMTRNPSLRNFAPRLGLAWDPTGSGKTSVRAGFGIFYEQVVLRYWTQAMTSNPPFFVRGELRSPPIENTYAEMLRRLGRLRPEITTIAFDLSTPTMFQYNLTLQREIAPQTVVTVGYAGSHGVHNFRAGESNIAFPEILPDGRKFFREGLERRNLNFESDRRNRSDAQSFYNSLQLSLNRQWRQGLQLQGSYTLSKSIDDASAQFSAALGGEHNSIDPESHHRNRGLSLFDVRHNFVFNSTWDIPLGPGRRFGSSLSGAAGKLVGGWQLGSILTISSGHPETPVLSFNQSRNLATRNIFEVPNLKPGANNNPIEGISSGCAGFPAGLPLGGPDHYFDPCAFELQQAGFYGNLGRNALIGPSVTTLDFSLVKNFPVETVSETFQVQFRAEFFNALNRANFGAPGTDDVLLPDRTANPAIGRITDTTTTSRQVQFGLKVIW